MAAGAVAAGSVSGGAFNPAIGVALPAVHGKGDDIWIYLLGPYLGAIAAGLVFRFVTASPEDVPKKATAGEEGREMEARRSDGL